ncbi:MAG: pantetheine-phosphate adenylyltransferase [Crocinitomicaceae bacterium]|nr:pantetheine-phosphate adenylyltransferase [Crocinitomicaceae bacterium]|tara:strand:+ start:3641 stop:4105 length:465 start_codon:yes stop_codon:yes gene_type:complete
MRKAVFAGSFDPITLGHENVVRRSVSLFDEIIVAVGVNFNKESRFSKEDRIVMLEAVFSDLPSVMVQSYSGLTADFCMEIGASWLLRGVRNSSDFEYECTIAQMTKKLAPTLETTILFTKEEFSSISSTIVRDVIANGGDVSEFVPAAALEFIK